MRTPCFLIDEKKLTANLELLKNLQEETGCRILLAQKAFSGFSCYPLMKQYLAGTTASGLYEARLGREEFGGETHVYSPAYRADEFDEILQYADDIVFNSPAQLRKYGKKAKAAGKSIGLRINPEYSTQEGHAIYDPCSPGSRLGTILTELNAALDSTLTELNVAPDNTLTELNAALNNKLTELNAALDVTQDESLISMLDGLHFHTLCEQNSDDLASTAAAFEEKFGKYLKQMKWINMGGGHHITRADYDLETLKKVIRHFQDTYHLTVYLEPGEAVVLNAGYLVTEVLEIVHNQIDIAILDTSAACHMPDVLEMPYRPPLQGSGEAQVKPYTYRLAGPTCLAGDVIGDYSFDEPLREGQRLVFEDMALYTMVKTNTFNGMRLPDIGILRQDGSEELIRSFGYEDFKCRLS